MSLRVIYKKDKHCLCCGIEWKDRMKIKCWKMDKHIWKPTYKNFKKYFIKQKKMGGVNVSKKYFVRNKERGFVGNCCLWWRWDNKGYTCDIRAAKKFSHEELEIVEIFGNSKYEVFEVEYVEGIIQHHVDIQDIRAGRTIAHTVE